MTRRVRPQQASDHRGSTSNARHTVLRYGDASDSESDSDKRTELRVRVRVVQVESCVGYNQLQLELFEPTNFQVSVANARGLHSSQMPGVPSGRLGVELAGPLKTRGLFGPGGCRLCEAG